nr:MAG TPA: hypothetical protein [Bacteriophage sp.]
MTVLKVALLPLKVVTVPWLAFNYVKVLCNALIVPALAVTLAALATF